MSAIVTPALTLDPAIEKPVLTRPALLITVGFCMLAALMVLPFVEGRQITNGLPTIDSFDMRGP